MGEPNNVLNSYMSRADRIRSVLEYYLGQKIEDDWVFEAEDGFYKARNSKGRISYRQRDIIRKVRALNFNFWLGLENQYTINLIYPWRLMEMDCCTYGAEIERIQEQNEIQGVDYTAEDDFKYRYRKEDRLEPVLNLTLYWGKKPWRTPISLKDMMDMGAMPEKLQSLFGDYKVHLIHMRAIPETELEKMDSDLKYVLGLMKCTRSKKKYREYIEENREYFSRIPRSAVDVIDVCTNIKDIRAYLQFKDTQITQSGEEEADMCYALDEIIKEGKREGKREGKKEGAKEGIHRTNKLNQHLLADGRQADLVKSITDPLFQKKLFREYGI